MQPATLPKSKDLNHKKGNASFFTGACTFFEQGTHFVNVSHTHWQIHGLKKKGPHGKHRRTRLWLSVGCALCEA